MEFLENHNSILYFFSTLAQFSLGVIAVSVSLAIFKVKSLNEFSDYLWGALFNHLKKHKNSDFNNQSIEFIHLRDGMEGGAILDLARRIEGKCERTHLLLMKFNEVDNDISDIFIYAKKTVIFSIFVIVSSFVVIILSHSFYKEWGVVFFIYCLFFVILVCYGATAFSLINKILKHDKLSEKYDSGEVC